MLVRRYMHERLRELRKRAGLTQAQIATHVDLTPGAVSNVESGARLPSLEVLQKWVAACGAQLAIVEKTDGPTDALPLLNREDREIVVDLIALLPRLDPAHRVTLMSLLETWDRVTSSAELSRNVTKRSS